MDGGVARLEIRAAGAADQTCVAGEGPIRQQKAVAVVCVSRRAEDIQHGLTTRSRSVRSLVQAGPRRRTVLRWSRGAPAIHGTDIRRPSGRDAQTLKQIEGNGPFGSHPPIPLEAADRTAGPRPEQAVHGAGPVAQIVEVALHQGH